MSCTPGTGPQPVGQDAISALRKAALDQAQIAGLTHCFYRYPARFSPRFAAAAIELFSEPGDLVLDPYMGGATTVVEAVARDRAVVGSDVNSLSVFLGRVKTTTLSATEQAALERWADFTVPALSYWSAPDDLSDYICARRSHNLNLPQARPIKKIIALGLRSLDKELPSGPAKDFARCALLNASQLFLNGQRRRRRPLSTFRARLQATVHEMLAGINEFKASVESPSAPTLLNCSAATLAEQEPFASGRRADLVVTSPPYPGIHMLYHRWQVDGRRETPAPYWMANCNDGRGNSYYNFADRRSTAEEAYFAESRRTLKGIRSVVAHGGLIVQLLAFSDPASQLRRYLENMKAASFEEVKLARRLWRDVPSRRWHANFKGKLSASREVVLVHRAV